MREMITVIARCGHPQTLEITYDGRLFVTRLKPEATYIWQEETQNNQV